MKLKLFLNKILNKLVNLGYKRTYTVYKRGNDYRLVKILNVYDNHEDASDDMVNVSTNHKSEIELLNTFDKTNKY